MQEPAFNSTACFKASHDQCLLCTVYTTVLYHGHTYIYGEAPRGFFFFSFFLTVESKRIRSFNTSPPVSASVLCGRPGREEHHCGQGLFLCEFAKYGCTERGSRVELDAHCEEDAPRHLRLVMLAVEAVSATFKAERGHTHTHTHKHTTQHNTQQRFPGQTLS